MSRTGPADVGNPLQIFAISQQTTNNDGDKYFLDTSNIFRSNYPVNTFFLTAGDGGTGFLASLISALLGLEAADEDM